MFQLWVAPAYNGAGITLLQKYFSFWATYPPDHLPGLRPLMHPADYPFHWFFCNFNPGNHIALMAIFMLNLGQLVSRMIFLLHFFLTYTSSQDRPKLLQRRTARIMAIKVLTSFIDCFHSLGNTYRGSKNNNNLTAVYQNFLSCRKCR